MAQALSPEQIHLAIEALNELITASPDVHGVIHVEHNLRWDKERAILIENQLLPLLRAYLSQEVGLDAFKTRVDSINKKNELWGFKGIKGQMFFNLLRRAADNNSDLDNQLRIAIEVPNSEQDASEKIKVFCLYIEQVGKAHVASGGSKHAAPNVSSVPFFLSYFWQIQDREVWPVYYTSSVNALTDMNLWQPSGNLAQDYLSYKNIHEELAREFQKETGRVYGLYDVEHVFWFKKGNPLVPDEPPATATTSDSEDSRETTEGDLSRPSKLPESYIPPIIAILPRMATNEPGLEDAAKESGTNLVSAFEKSVNAAFTILGYETELLGQGRGRVPDGLALAVDHGYAILWDAKIRKDGYTIGTDDRTIKDYIITEMRKLKTRQRLTNVYYFLISSSFSDNFDDAIRSIKMETEISEVCLVEAGSLVEMVDQKLRTPHQVGLGPDGLQPLFSTSGILSAKNVRELLM